MAARLSLMARPHDVPGRDVRLLMDVARAADAAGFHSLQFGEHLVMGNRPDRYPYGAFRHDPTVPWLEPMTTLGWIAGATQRLRLSASVLLAPLRSAPLLAKTIATLDVLSQGRVELGLGVGWQPEEYALSGLDWDNRFQDLERIVAGCRRLWGEQPVSWAMPDGGTESFHVLPRPVQTRVPLLFGLKMTRRNAARIADLGDGWCPPSAFAPAQVREGVAILRDVLKERGRDMRGQIIRASLPHVRGADGRLDVPACFASAGELLDCGATVLAIATPAAPQTMAEVTSFIEAAAREAERY